MKAIRKKSMMIMLAMLVALGGIPGWTMPGIRQAAAAATGIWEPVGNAGLTTGESVNTDLFIAADGTPYVAYKDGTNSYKAAVKKYNGSSWVTVGNSGFSSGAANNIQIYVDNGTPYVLYSDEGQSGRIFVMKFDGTNWGPVGGGPLTSVNSAYFHELSIYVYNGVPYVAFPDPANQLKGTMKRFNGSGWETLGGFFTTTTVSSLSLYVYEGTPYLGYQRGFGGNKANVIKFNGSGWETVGNADLSGGASDYLSLYVDAGTPYLAYQDSDNGKRITVRKLDGGTWQPIGIAGFSAGTSTHTSLFVYGGTPYVAYKNYNDNGIMVMKYAGSAWELLGGGLLGSGTYPSLYVYDGVPYVAYQDYGVSSKVTVKKLKKTVTYDGNGSTTGTVPAGTIGYDKNAVVTVLGNAGNLEKTGHSFTGWNTAADGSGTPYGAGATFAMGEDALTLYAQWTINNYQVAYDGNGSTGGGVPAGGSYAYGTAVTVQGNAGNLIKTGHTFAGWNTAADGNGTNYDAGSSLTVGPANVTLYARWTANSYALDYDGNGSTGGGVPAGGSYVYGSGITISGNSGNLTKTGHTFAGVEYGGERKRNGLGSCGYVEYGPVWRYDAVCAVDCE
ncbi:InlB B-repeat-containing protein [Cohnella cholangitidis]|nr:InlB B-repeat-containing protein [Cohnella cholangitidis]